jgi:hypothetical protein
MLPPRQRHRLPEIDAPIAERDAGLDAIASG